MRLQTRRARDVALLRRVERQRDDNGGGGGGGVVVMRGSFPWIGLSKRERVRVKARVRSWVGSDIFCSRFDNHGGIDGKGAGRFRKGVAARMILSMSCSYGTS